MPFEAPDPLLWGNPNPPAPLMLRHPPCHDRGHFRYTNLCSSSHNYELNFAPESKQPNQRRRHFWKTRCVDRPHHDTNDDREPASDDEFFAVGEDEWLSDSGDSNRPDPEDNLSQGSSETGDDAPPDTRKPRYVVCRYCIAATENLPWFKRGMKYITEKPTGEQGHAAELRSRPTSRSLYYLTRLCRLCEMREQQLLSQLEDSGDDIPPDPEGDELPSEGEREKMWDWPRNRCTCAWPLYSEVRCRDHRKLLWEPYKDEQRAAIIKNKAFLESIVLRGNITHEANQEDRARRNEQRLWRACRCGADPVSSVETASVMQCMACEGIVHFGDGGRRASDPVFSRERLRENLYENPDLFQLNRPRQPEVPATGGSKDRAYWNSALRP